MVKPLDILGIGIRFLSDCLLVANICTTKQSKSALFCTDMADSIVSTIFFPIPGAMKCNPHIGVILKILLSTLSFSFTQSVTFNTQLKALLTTYCDKFFSWLHA